MTCLHFVLHVPITPAQIHAESSRTWDGTRKRGVWKAITFKWGHEGETSMMELVSLWEEEEIELGPPSVLGGPSQKTAICKPGKGSSRKPDHAGTSSWTSQPPGLWERHFWCLSHLIRAIFVIAAQTKTSFKIIYDTYFNLDLIFIKILR